MVGERPVGMRPVKLAHVARAAGVSIPTASKALNGTGSIAPATVTRIQSIAAELGYRSNPTARSLRVGPGQVVAAVIDRRETTASSNTPRMFWKEFVDELIDCLAHQQIALLITTPEAVATLTSLPVSAVLVVSSEPDSVVLPPELPFGIPVTSYTFAVDAAEHSLTFRHDIPSMASDAFQHIRGGGSRRPALLGMAERGHLSDIFSRTYRQWCLHNDVKPLEFTTDGSVDNVAETVDAVVQADVDGLVSLYAGSRVLLAEFARNGVRIPTDLQIVVQAEGVIEDVLSPPVTTLSFSARRCAHICAETLMEWTTSKSPEVVTLPFQLTPRGSTNW